MSMVSEGGRRVKYDLLSESDENWGEREDWNGIERNCGEYSPESTLVDAGDVRLSDEQFVSLSKIFLTSDAIECCVVDPEGSKFRWHCVCRRAGGEEFRRPARTIRRAGGMLTTNRRILTEVRRRLACSREYRLRICRMGANL